MGSKVKKEIAISVKNVSKSFKLPHEQHSGIKQTLLNLFKSDRKPGYEVQRVLKDISFDVEKGDFFGIVGRNGSGKSTLLKLISEIYTPDRGHISVNGQLTPFIELGVGFNPELTGRENVFMNGALLGFSRKEMEEMYDDIVEFAELERFMDQRLKNYSSGMQVRLAFSIAIRADSDILVLDEVLAVGDEAFQRKCFNYFAELKRNKKTVILVTHSMENVTRFCNKALMIEDGEIVESGSVKAVSERYIKANSESNDNHNTTLPDDENTRIFNGRSAKASVELFGGRDKPQRVFRDTDNDKQLKIDVKVEIKEDIDKETYLSILIKNDQGSAIMRLAKESQRAGDILDKPRQGDVIVMSAEIENIFGEGEYFIATSLKSIDQTEFYIDSEDRIKFSVVGLGINGYSLRPPHTLELRSIDKEG